MTTVFLFFKQRIKEAFDTSWILFKIMIPVSIVIKALSMFNLIPYIGDSLAPIMKIVGLPGEYSLVWVTAMLTNLYGGILAFLALSKEYPLTVAQVTILTTMMLVAHNFFVELKIATKSGVRFLAIFSIRFFGAIAIGALLAGLYRVTGTLTAINKTILEPKTTDPSISAWALKECANYGKIFLMILTLLTVLYFLKKWGVMAWLIRMFDPVLKMLGIGSEVADLTMIGMTLGVAYGGGLIIKEAQAGHISKKDIFYAMALMGLSHSVIEDTLLMMSLGASITGVLIGRVLFTLIVMWIMVRFVERLPLSVVHRLCVRIPKEENAS